MILDSPLLKTTEMDASLTQLIFNILGIFKFFLILIQDETFNSWH